MSRRLAAVLLVVVMVSTVGIGVTVWLVVSHHPSQRPQISAYSDGHLSRVGPYRYCNVLNLRDCQEPRTVGVLAVNGRDPVQLSVPTTIGAAPWRLLRVYDDARNPIPTFFRPNTRLAVTIGTVDPQRGRLTGIVVQLLTLVVNAKGEFTDVPHAEWSMRTVWP